MRQGDWERALAAYLADAEGRPFVYGEHDCAMFAAGAVTAMRGDDPMAEFRGTYKSAATSVRALREHGAGTLEATLNTKFPAIPIGFARRGDLALFQGSVGVVVGGFALFVGEEEDAAGLVRIERADWDRAWAVG